MDPAVSQAAASSEHGNAVRTDSIQSATVEQRLSAQTTCSLEVRRRPIVGWAVSEGTTDSTPVSMEARKHMSGDRAQSMKLNCAACRTSDRSACCTEIGTLLLLPETAVPAATSRLWMLFLWVLTLSGAGTRQGHRRARPTRRRCTWSRLHGSDRSMS